MYMTGVPHRFCGTCNLRNGRHTVAVFVTDMRQHNYVLLYPLKTLDITFL